MKYGPSLAPELYAVAEGQENAHLMDLMRGQARTPVATDSSLPRFTIVAGPSPFTMPRGWEFFLASPYEGISYIATVLLNAGYPVRIVDVRYARDPLSEAFRQIIEGTDVLGIATWEDNYPFVEDLVREMKAARPDIPVILGGSLVTSVPHVFMKEMPADIAVISEGELTILELLDAYTKGEWDRRLREIHGIWWRDREGSVHRNPPRGQMPNLDSLPPMRLDLWPQAKDPRGLQPQVIASYSRGCKMDCAFCYRTTPQERVKSPDTLRRDLKWLKEQYRTEFVFFVDLTFTAHKKQILLYLDVIKEFDLHWTCLTRNADVDAEVARAMAAAGCTIPLYGVESLAPEALKGVRKGSSENLVFRAMKNTWEAGMAYGGLTIVGLPGETEDSLDHMCSWAEQHKHITRVKYLSAMPGASLYSGSLQDGTIRSELDHLRWLSVEQSLERDEYLNYNGLTDRVMRRSYKRLYDSYQPGPVMDFCHWPEHFAYFDPDADPSRPWRKKFSSAGGHLYAGSLKYRGMVMPSVEGVTFSLRPDVVPQHV